MNYKQQKVVRRVEGGLVIYVCLERIADAQFCVHQMEFIPANQINAATKGIDELFFELFSEEDPSNRCDWFESLDIAIETHDRDFQN